MVISDRNKQVSNVGIPIGEEGFSATDGLDEVVEAITDNLEEEFTGDEEELNRGDRKPHQ